MYYSENANQSIYCPDVIQSPVNQKSFYSNSFQNQLSNLEEFSELLKCRLDTGYKDINKKVLDLDSYYKNLEALQTKTMGELSQHKSKQENLKKRLLNRQYRLENLITEELQSFMTSQENVNKAVFEQLDQQEKMVDEKLRPVISQQGSIKRKILNHLEQHRMAVSKKLQLMLTKQENVNRRVVNQLDKQELVNKQVVNQLDKYELVNKQVVNQLEEHESVILQELQPFIKSIQDNLANPIANLVKNLSPGTLIEKITVQGTEIEVKSFLDYNFITNASTFLLKDNKILSINTNRIDSLTFS